MLTLLFSFGARGQSLADIDYVPLKFKVAAGATGHVHGLVNVPSLCLYREVCRFMRAHHKERRPKNQKNNKDEGGTREWQMGKGKQNATRLPCSLQPPPPPLALAS